MQLLINNDILQHILNPYLLYNTDIQKIQKAIPDLKFLLRPHLSNHTNKWIDEEDCECWRDEVKCTCPEIIQTDTWCDNELIRTQKWYLNGEKKADNSYENHRIHGTQLEWYQNGNICRIENFKNGSYHGWQMSFRRDGTICSKSKFKNHKNHGKAYIYDKRGNIVAIRNYRNNIQI
jgi:hypothetical protein